MKITQVSSDARRDVKIKQISSDQEICERMIIFQLHFLQKSSYCLRTFTYLCIEYLIFKLKYLQMK